MTITNFTVASDFKSLRLEATATVGSTFNLAEIYIGDNYLSTTPVVITSLVTGLSTVAIDITLANLGLNEDDLLIGIFTLYITDTSTAAMEQGIANLYFMYLCLANTIASHSIVSDWNNINAVYMLLKSIPIYLASSQIASALNSYDRCLAMLEQNPKYLVTTDMTPCVTGAGCWIINGTYIIA